jgi:hypothetical protein
MPECPSKAHAFVLTVYELPTYLADREVEETSVARRAGETERSADDLRRTGIVVVAE